MRRRDFISLLGGTAAWPLAARAQQPRPVIGFLSNRSPDGDRALMADFRRGLAETGFVEQQNLAIESRWADAQYDRLPALAADLIRRQVKVIVASGPAAAVAKAATLTVPIVFTVGVDPVEIGLVTGLSRPGGNLTGVTTLAIELGPKRLELLHELVPAATVFALLVNPAAPTTQTQSRAMQAAAAAIGVQLHVLHASTDRDFDAVFATLAALRAGGLVIGVDPLFSDQSEQLGALSLRHAMPMIFRGAEFAAAGGLIGYGGSNADSNRLVGVYTGRILKGEKPADLPVQQVTKVEMIVNLRTAKALGLTVPLALLTRADEVIE